MYINGLITVIIVLMYITAIAIISISKLAIYNSGDTKYIANKKTLKIILKILAVLILIIFMMFNYRIISIKGISQTSYGTKSVAQNINEITNIKKIEYYKTSKNEEYIIYIQTNSKAYLTTGTQDTVEQCKIISQLMYIDEPNQIQPIPYYIEVIIILVISLLPTKKRLIANKKI